MLRAGFSSRRKGEGQVQCSVRGNHPLLLQNGVEPVGCHTPLPLSKCLDIHAAHLAFTEQMCATTIKRRVNGAPTSLDNPLPCCKELFVSHLFRIVCNGKHTTQQEAIFWNLLAWLMAKQLGYLRWLLLLRLSRCLDLLLL